MFLLVLRKW
jgi:hypothetical protein